MGKLGFCTSWAVNNKGSGREWIETVQIDLKLQNLATPFHGTRIVHISDLHCSNTVSTRYLRHCIDKVNLLDADIVLLTGDYITYDYFGRFREFIVNLLGTIKSRFGVYACLGNHDYGVGGVSSTRKDDALEAIVTGMSRNGIDVLCNKSSSLELSGHRLWFVGLGDLWADDFNPQKAFADIDRGEAVIALSHNPDTLRHLSGFNFGAMLSGHTHGCELEWKIADDRPLLTRRRFHTGLYDFGDKKLYVNRGLGRHGRMFFNKRPEITVYNLL